MKAVVFNEHGSPDVLRLEQVEKPTPRDNDVLIRVRATTVSTAGMALRKGDPFIARLFTGLRKPSTTIPGT